MHHGDASDGDDGTPQVAVDRPALPGARELADPGATRAAPAGHLGHRSAVPDGAGAGRADPPRVQGGSFHRARRSRRMPGGARAELRFEPLRVHVADPVLRRVDADPGHASDVRALRRQPAAHRCGRAGSHVVAQGSEHAAGDRRLARRVSRRSRAPDAPRSHRRDGIGRQRAHRRAGRDGVRDRVGRRS